MSQKKHCKKTGYDNTKHTPIRSRRWCISLNNYSEIKLTQVTTYFKKNKCSFIIGKEGDGKTPHLQIYVEYKNAVRFKTLKNNIPRGHIEKAKRTKAQNITYCSKEGNYTTNFLIGKEPKIRWFCDMDNMGMMCPDCIKHIIGGKRCAKAHKQHLQNWYKWNQYMIKTLP